MDDSGKNVCPNCHATHDGSYCNFCGQKHYSHKETFGELVFKFFSDFTHFDSRFFRTVLPLLFKPGVLTNRYIEGKKASQFHPIRLYLFSSFIYFLLFFGCSKKERFNSEEMPSIAIEKDSLEAERKYVFAPFSIKAEAEEDIVVASSPDSTTRFTIKGLEGLDSLTALNMLPAEYQRMQDSLPEQQRDNFIKRYAMKQSLKLYQEGKRDGTGLMNKIYSSVTHNIPKMFFILLPLFALLLKLLYIREKQYYYVDHAIYSLHYFSFIFILLILSQFVLGPIFKTDLFLGIAMLWMALYMFIAMKRIYRQRFRKTLLKYSLLGISFFLLVAVAFAVNLMVSAAVA